MKNHIESQSIPIGKSNGDFILYQELPNGATLILLADGMGGLSFPEIASKIVCEAISEYFSNVDVLDSSEHIRRSIEYADDRLASYSKQRKCKMGLALLLAYIKDGMLSYTNLGDVRLYHRNKQGKISQLTDDNLIVQGGDTFLTDYIAGRGFRSTIQVQYLSLNAGDAILLCSDGFYNTHNISQSFHHITHSQTTSLSDDSSVVKVEIIQ